MFVLCDFCQRRSDSFQLLLKTANPKFNERIINAHVTVLWSIEFWSVPFFVARLYAWRQLVCGL
jgi:hypothetical protein